MLRRILLLLSETPAGKVARQCAFRLARADNAELMGIAGVDLAYIDAPMVGGIGTTYRWQAGQELKKQASETSVRLRNAYERECKTNSVAFEWQDFEGDPVEALQAASERSDLIVMGHDTGFRGNIRERLPDTIEALCRMSPRPLIVCGDEDHADADILIAYDASPPAMRAVQLFALLGLWPRKRVHVVAIGTEKATVDRVPVGAAQYLRGRGYDVETVSIATRAHPADVLRIEVADRKCGILVMGVYGHSSLADRLFGSTTTRLLEEPPCALFVSH